MGVHRRLDAGIEKLRGMMGDMAAIAVAAFKRAMESIFTGKTALKEVKIFSDQLLIMREEVDRLAIELTARFQPAATDLRRIRSYIQAAYDFSRIGRYSLNICEAGLLISVVGCDFSKLKQLYILALYMVREIGRSLIFEDLDLAKRVRDLDDDVDALCDNYLKDLLSQRSKKDDPSCLMAETLVLRYLERIADHACYVADAVTYIKTGGFQI